MLDLLSASGCATIQLARPDLGNALSAEFVEALAAAISEASSRDDIHTLVIRSTGRHFCTGFYLGDLEAQTDGDLLLRFVRIELMLQALWSAPIRTVSVGNGRVIGAGADLFAACDIRVAVPAATFRFPGAGFGLVLGTRRLAMRVGADRARDWLLNGREIDAVTALEAGLVTHIVEQDELGGWLEEHTARPGIDNATVAALHRAMRDEDGHADLANLVRSARPGLRDRLKSYVQKQARSGPAKQ